MIQDYSNFGGFQNFEATNSSPNMKSENLLYS